MAKTNAEGKAGPRRIPISSPEEEPLEESAGAECPFIPEGDPASAEAPAAVRAQNGADEQATEEEMGKLQEMLGELEQKCAFAEDQHLRVAAELQNYKRRVHQEKEQLARFALEGLVTELIPTLDNFERAMEVKVDSAGAECLMAGVKMIYDQLQNVLAGHGVERIEALGADFDPHLHEAVEKEVSTALPPNVIVRELARGYTLNGRLLRPARVRVTVPPAQE
jgi:molecular chaperone GrpE